MRFPLAAAVTFAVLFMFPSPGRAQVLTEHDVSVRMALTIAETALAECGVKTSVAVVDRAGRLRVFLQGDGASPHNLELARRKANLVLSDTTSVLARSDGELVDLLAGGQGVFNVVPLSGLVHELQADIVAFERPAAAAAEHRTRPARAAGE